MSKKFHFLQIPPHWYSSESSRWALSNEYQCDRVPMIIQLFTNLPFEQNHHGRWGVKTNIISITLKKNRMLISLHLSNFHCPKFSKFRPTPAHFWMSWNKVALIQYMVHAMWHPSVSRFGFAWWWVRYFLWWKRSITEELGCIVYSPLKYGRLHTSLLKSTSVHWDMRQMIF